MILSAGKLRSLHSQQLDDGLGHWSEDLLAFKLHQVLQLFNTGLIRLVNAHLHLEGIEVIVSLLKNIVDVEVRQLSNAILSVVLANSQLAVLGTSPGVEEGIWFNVCSFYAKPMLLVKFSPSHREGLLEEISLVFVADEDNLDLDLPLEIHENLHLLGQERVTERSIGR